MSWKLVSIGGGEPKTAPLVRMSRSSYAANQCRVWVCINRLPEVVMKSWSSMSRRICERLQSVLRTLPIRLLTALEIMEAKLASFYPAVGRNLQKDSFIR